MLRVTFVGSGGVVVTKERCCSSILVDQDILMDCGGGSLKNLRELNIDLGGLRKFLISHYHQDHIGDLASILWAMEFTKRKEALEIMGYDDIKEFTTTLLRLGNTPEEITVLNYNFRSLKGNEEFDEIKTCVTKHEPTNLAFRIERNGRSLCYTGDTTFYEPLVKFASNCNLLIHDSTFLEEQKAIATLTNHSTAVDAGRMARMAKVNILILFHISPYNAGYEKEYLKQAAEEFDGEVLVAKDLQTVEI